MYRVVLFGAKGHPFKMDVELPILPNVGDFIAIDDYPTTEQAIEKRSFVMEFGQLKYVALELAEAQQ